MKIIKINLYDDKISKFLFILRNKNYVRKNSLNKEIITYQNHKYWLKKFLKKNTIKILVYKKQMAGYVRLIKSKTYIDCSWAVLRKFQGKGIATKALKAITNDKKTYRAIVKIDNIASKLVAKKANFRLGLSKKDLEYYYKN